MTIPFPIPPRLRAADTILIAGAGGGFDVYCGIPLYLALRGIGKTVHLANLSFSALTPGSGDTVTRSTVRVTADSIEPVDYFPERTLCEWLVARGDEVCIYAFEKTGVAPLTEAYAHLERELDLDAIVLVDGGTDSLMRGDEAGLGTPAEDMVSLAAARATGVSTKLLYCLGFGVDAFHGVCHAQFLEAVAALARDGGYLGAFSLTAEMDEARAYMDAVEHSTRCTPSRPSIVNTSIQSALEGLYGDAHKTARTRSSSLWINPLMSLYWMFDLDAVAARNLYLDELLDTQTMFDVVVRIEAVRKQLARDGRIRAYESIPV